MFDAEKKDQADAVLASMCHQCGSNHTPECPLSKAREAVNNIPTK